MKRSEVTYPNDNNDVAIITTSDKYRRQVIIDRGDAELLSMVSWYASKPDRAGRIYVRRYVSINGKIRGINIHRVIMSAPRDMVVDHINGNGLDNRRCNLRVCTQSTNLHNRTRFKKNKVGQYLGTYYEKDRKRWRAEIIFNGRRIHTKRFRTEYEAHLAYQEKKRELLGSSFIR